MSLFSHGDIHFNYVQSLYDEQLPQSQSNPLYLEENILNTDSILICKIVLWQIVKIYVKRGVLSGYALLAKITSVTEIYHNLEVLTC